MDIFPFSDGELISTIIYPESVHTVQMKCAPSEMCSRINVFGHSNKLLELFRSIIINGGKHVIYVKSEGFHGGDIVRAQLQMHGVWSVFIDHDEIPSKIDSMIGQFNSRDRAVYITTGFIPRDLKNVKILHCLNFSTITMTEMIRELYKNDRYSSVPSLEVILHVSTRIDGSSSIDDHMAKSVKSKFDQQMEYWTEITAKALKIYLS